MLHVKYRTSRNTYTRSKSKYCTFEKTTIGYLVVMYILKQEYPLYLSSVSYLSSLWRAQPLTNTAGVQHKALPECVCDGCVCRLLACWMITRCVFVCSAYIQVWVLRDTVLRGKLLGQNWCTGRNQHCLPGEGRFTKQHTSLGLLRDLIVRMYFNAVCKGHPTFCMGTCCSNEP